MSLPMGVMVTNDDGPPSAHAPHLLAFTRHLKQWLKHEHQQSVIETTAETARRPAPRAFVCTPAAQQSWVGKAVTRFGQVRAHTNWNAQLHLVPSSMHISPLPAASPVCSAVPPYATHDDVIAAGSVMSASPDLSLWSTVEASPSSTVNVGLHVLAPFPIDLVLSGPNLGRNTGRSFILSSGTVGAAIEAAFAGKRSIAISFAYFVRLSDVTDEMVEHACAVAMSVISRLWHNWPQHVDLFNVNIPLAATSGTQQLLMTSVLQDSYKSIYKPRDFRHKGQSTPALGPATVEPFVSANGLSIFPVSSFSPSSAATTAIAAPHSPTLHSIPSANISMTNVPAATHEIDFKFNVDMFHEDWSNLTDFVGSDYWAVKSNHVSITPLNCTLIETKLSDQQAEKLFPRFKPGSDANKSAL